MRNRTKTSTAILCISLALVIGIAIGSFLSPKQLSDSNIRLSKNQDIQKINDIFSLIETEYVDPINRDSLIETFINTTLSTLDPHSRYLSAEEMAKEEEFMQGHFEGIGVVLTYDNDTARINQVFADGPSDGKLQVGDRILRINNEVVAGKGLSNDEIVQKIRGPRRTKVTLGIKRYGEEGTRNITLVRDVIQTYSISYSGMLDNHIGYIRLTKFVETSYDEFRQAISKLNAEGMTELIFDLRANGGGLMDAAIKIADELLPNQEIIVYTQGEHEARHNIYSHKGGLFPKGKLIILIDENSASASEIVSGAIQDNDRGTIIGRRSFGKGLVQRQFRLTDGSAILLTVSRYYTPSGRCIQRPYDKGSDEYYMDYLNRVIYDMTDDSTLTQITDSTPYYTTKGRIVYGGGGIYPDHPIKYQSDDLYRYYNKLLEKGLPSKFASDIVCKDWAHLKECYPTLDQFFQLYTISNQTWSTFLRYAEINGVKTNPASVAKYGEEMRLRIKAEVGTCLYGYDAFYKIMLSKDNDIEQAIKIIKATSR